MFFTCWVPYIPICFYHYLILCFDFHFFFLTLLSTRHILEFTMFDSISSQPARNIAEINKYYIVHGERKSVELIITKINALI